VIVFSLAPTAEEETDFLAAGMPLVLVDASSSRLPCVVVDDLAGGEMSARHLIELGHRRIGFVGDEYPNRFGFGFHNLREQGYVRALEHAGLESGPHLIATGLFGREEARQSALRLLRLPDPPTAIVAGSDTQAMGVLAAARELGLDVPRQLSVVGYDDIEIAGYLGLTTINQSLYESGREGARLLLDSLEAVGGSPPVPVRRLLPLRLSLRHTTAPPPA